MILVCHADSNIRERWKKSLEHADDITEISDLDVLIRVLNTQKSELVLLHLQLPRLNGSFGVRAMLQKNPHLPFFVFSDKPREAEGLELLADGVRGYANTLMNPRILNTAVEVISKGEIWLGRQLIQRLIADVATSSKASITADNQAFALLTCREKEIAALVGGGATNKSVASRLGITERTVKAHLSRIFSKTGTRGRLQLALMVNANPL